MSGSGAKLWCMADARLLLFVSVAPLCLSSGQAQTVDYADCTSMSLPVIAKVDPPEQYRVFCTNNPGACELEGASEIPWSPDNQRALARINRGVNEETTYVSDWEFSGLDDVWNYPFQCHGDCEDFVLEKRRRLVEEEFPGAALNIATAIHKLERYPHAVLLAETSRGTWVLDNYSDALLCWDDTPYRFTRRELPDGQWIKLGSR